MGVTTKKTYEYIVDLFDKEGYKVLDTEYVNSRHKMKTLCPNNHIYMVDYYLFHKRKYRCPECSGNKHYTLETARKIFEDGGFKLISDKYIKNTKPLEVLCSNGHIWKVSLNNFLKKEKQTCPQCIGHISKHTLESLKKMVESAGYKLVTENYNHKEKIHTICPNGHDYFVKQGDFYTGYRCRECAGKTPYTLETAKKEYLKEGYILKDEVWSGYIGKSNLICPNGHEIQIPLDQFKSKGQRCEVCHPHIRSKAEMEIFDWIKTFYPNTKHSEKLYKEDGTFFKYDVYVPDIKLMIEFHGLRWHSKQFKKEHNYHFDKMELANKNGIRLISIFEDEWNNRKDQVKSFLLSALNKNIYYVNARETEIKQINKEESKIFLDSYHIQGNVKNRISLGLYYKNELVAVMTGSDHHRQNNNGSLILSRLVFKEGISVRGGASKLLKYLILYAKQNNYRNIISWSDNRWSEGNVYKKLGFELEEELKPDYSYVKNNERLSKQSNQKKHLIKKGAIGTMADTEEVLALSLKLYRIYDCGKKRWIIHI